MKNLTFFFSNSFTSYFFSRYRFIIFDRTEAFNNTSHNQFLNVLIYYGFPALMILVLFYFIIFKRLLGDWALLKNKKNDEYNWLVLGIGGALISYIINSLFHNEGIFVGDIFSWYLIGLFLAVNKVIIDYEKRHTVS
jgi:O-antigen ligase